MKNLPTYEEFINEKYKFSDFVVSNIPSDNENMWIKINWVYNTLSRSMKNTPPTYKKNQELVWMMGTIKEIISTFAYQYVIKYIQPDSKITYKEFFDKTGYDMGYGGDDYGYGYNEGKSERDSYRYNHKSISPSINRYKEWGSQRKENDAFEVPKSDEHLKKCYDWCISHLGLTKRHLKDPQSSFDKLFEKVKKFYYDVRKKEEEESSAIDFFDRISGQSNPRLSLEDQLLVRKGEVLNDAVIKFIFGAKTYDLRAKMFLDTYMDLYRYPKVPTGGRLAQTMPETLLINYYKRMKQNVLAMGFDQDEFMDFIDKYIGFKNVKQWFKKGICYRIGYPPDKDSFRTWSPGSYDLEGVRKFASTFSYDAKFPKFLYFGVVEYFDLFGYMEYLMKELDYGSYNDNEREVLIKGGQNMESIEVQSQEELENAIKYLKK